MAHMRRLTADGPHAAYSRLLTQTVSRNDTGSGISKTPLERRGRYVESIDSEAKSSHHGRRGAGNLVLSQARVGTNSIERPQFDKARERQPSMERPQFDEGRERTPSMERPQFDEVRVRTNSSKWPRSEQAQPMPHQPTTAYDRLYMDSLKRQVKDQSDTISLLQKAQTVFLQQPKELPRFCWWECIAKVLTDIVSITLLGPGLNSHMYPLEDEMIPKILEAFNVRMDMKEEVELFLTEWGKGGKSNIQMRVSDNIQDRRGSILRTLREEFYLQLGLPKPRRTETEESRLAWKQRLLSLTHGNIWRISHEGDLMDPWGSNAVHHSISKVLFGGRYDTKATVNINLKQAGFFFHNLELAMDGAIMEPGRMIFHVRKMEEMEERIKNSFRRT